MIRTTSNILSVLLHPFILPTIGFVLLLNSGFYFAMLSLQAKWFIISVVFFTTGFLPFLTLAVLAINTSHTMEIKKSSGQILPLLFTAIYYYLAFFLFSRWGVNQVFKTIMLSSVILIVFLIIVSLRYRISTHLAAAGGLAGILLSLSFRFGINPLAPVIGVLLIAGLLATVLLILKKTTLLEMSTGYIAGVVITYLICYYF